jgi:hypothetical protein
MIGLNCMKKFIAGLIVLGVLFASVPVAHATSPQMPQCTDEAQEKALEAFTETFKDYEWDTVYCTAPGGYYELLLEGNTFESSSDLSYAFELHFYVSSDFSDVAYENITPFKKLKKIVDVIEGSESFKDNVKSGSASFKKKIHQLNMDEGRRVLLEVWPLYYIANAGSLDVIFSNDYMEYVKLKGDVEVVETINLSKKGVTLQYSDMTVDEFAEAHSGEKVDRKPIILPTDSMLIPPTNFFTRDLSLGTSGEDVLRLQKFLNQKGYTVAELGAGSVGNETTYFGPATRAALIRFQEAHALELGITQGTGYFGPLTRTLVN